MAELSIRTLPHQTKFVAVDHSAAGCSNNTEGMGLGPEIMHPPERPWGECLVGGGGRDLARHVEVLERIADVGAAVDDLVSRAVGNEGNHFVVMGLRPDLLVKDEKETGLSIHLLAGLVPRHPIGHHPLLPTIEASDVLRWYLDARRLLLEKVPTERLWVSSGTAASRIDVFVGTTPRDLPVLAYADAVPPGGVLGRLVHRRYSSLVADACNGGGRPVEER